MWSGPRNVSTAMMRAWGNRTDTVVIDEPFYAFYLKATGKNHPGAADIIANSETDWKKIVYQLTTSHPTGKAIIFQKQMTHHLLPEVDREWTAGLTNCLLIRDPREVILSYIKINPEPAFEDLGFGQQLEIFEFVRAKTEFAPPVIDAKDLLQNPGRILELLCNAIDVEFDPAMLNWPPGLRKTDGIWARYWYDDVARSTSFQPYIPKDGEVPNRLREIYDRSRDCYERLREHRLR